MLPGQLEKLQKIKLELDSICVKTATNASVQYIREWEKLRQSIVLIESKLKDMIKKEGGEGCDGSKTKQRH